MAIVYRRTRLVRYLDTARSMASYFLNNIPKDGIIPWDLNAPLVPARPADSSAAMIAANGLLLLAEQEECVVPSNGSAVSYYRNAAIQVPFPPSPLLVYAFMNVVCRFCMTQQTHFGNLHGRAYCLMGRLTTPRHHQTT